MIDLIVDISNKYNNFLKDIISNYDITFKQYEMLDIIYNQEKKVLYASDLVKLWNTDKRSVSLNINKLEERYFLVRIDDNLDSRLKQIILTEEALSIISDINLAISDYKQTLNDNYSVDELIILNELLANLNDIL